MTFKKEVQAQGYASGGIWVKLSGNKTYLRPHVPLKTVPAY
jgi:hypothetical protein